MLDVRVAKRVLGIAMVRDAESNPCPHSPDEPSSVAQTAWAVLTLLAVQQHATRTPANGKPGDTRLRRAVDRGIAYLVDRQTESGAWPHERATGVFFNTAVLDYKLYRQIFPAWALARHLGH